MTPDLLAVVLVLVAAFLHAATNALTKSSADPLLTRGFMSAVASAITLLFIPFVAPPTPEAWRYLVPSLAVHALYPFLLAAAYRRADLSLVFPIIRGLSPIGLLLLVAAFDAGGVSAGQIAGIALIVASVLLLCSNRAVSFLSTHTAALSFALATAAVVAGYTYLDAHGMRASAGSLSYIVWLVALDGAITAGAIALARRGAVMAFAAANWRHGLVTAALGVVNFGMAMYALGLGNIVEIGALRETSVIFAAFFGARFLGEDFARRRLIAAVLVVCGIVAMQLYR